MSTIIHAIIGYFFLLVVVRILSRRPGAQLTLFEFVIVFLIGGIIILATAGPDKSETNCTCAIITVALMHQLVSWLKGRFPRIGKIVDGTPLVLLKDGEWQNEAMRGMKIDAEDVMACARSCGIKTLSDIGYAVLERNGGISVFPYKKSK
jgi:uncharacterized membrane protein YcaP (DUF421 family)